MITVGIDHGTSGIKVCVRENGRNTFFVLSRSEIKNRSFIEELSKYVDPNKIDLISVCYSMGDGIDKILSIERVKNRGVVNIEGVGEKIGGGTKVFDEIKESNIPAVVIPGLHRGVKCLDRRFRALYSHIASPEKLCMAYCAYKVLKLKDFILSDISSNTVTLIVRDGKVFGGFDACIGAVGLLHGPIDLEMIREIDSGRITANEAFSTGGIIKIIRDRYRGVENTLEELLRCYKRDERCSLAVESLILSVAMEINALMILNPRRNIVLTGSLVNIEDFAIPERLKEYIDGNFYLLEGASGALGGALIAEDILKGVRNILGVEVDYR
ncbi:methanogenesis marker 12 protein [Methanothermococcus sp. SCGC AD-155-N22]|nr:methanogenesis marker 12 protein [Methanothermococcus sp. SCGC AD-155-N22]